MPTEIVDTTDLICPICQDGFDNGERIVIFPPCGHGLCYPCYGGLITKSPPMVRVWTLPGRNYVTESEPCNPNCPICRNPETDVSVVCIAQNYHKGTGKQSDPIIII